MIFILLWVLATLDSAFTGYREAAGRSALINKRSYYRRAMIKGALLGQTAVVSTGLIGLMAVATSSRPQSMITDFESAGERMLYVYVPYAVIILIAFLVRIIPSVDLRSITSTVIFGPFTLLRPLVAFAGVAWAILASSKAATRILCVLVLCLMLSLGQVLRWTNSK